MKAGYVQVVRRGAEKQIFTRLLYCLLLGPTVCLTNVPQCVSVCVRTCDLFLVAQGPASSYFGGHVVITLR